MGHFREDISEKPVKFWASFRTRLFMTPSHVRSQSSPSSKVRGILRPFLETSRLRNVSSPTESEDR